MHFILVGYLHTRLQVAVFVSALVIRLKNNPCSGISFQSLQLQSYKLFIVFNYLAW